MTQHQDNLADELRRSMARHGDRISASQALEYATTLEDINSERLDPHMIPVIAALVREGIVTTASCEGHAGRGLPYPWVDIAPESVEAMAELLDNSPELTGFQLVGKEDQGARLKPRAMGDILDRGALGVWGAKGLKPLWQTRLLDFAKRLLEDNDD